MAREDAVIRIVTEGEDRVNRLFQSVSKLGDILDRINDSSVAIDKDRGAARDIQGLEGRQLAAANLQNQIIKNISAITQYAEKNAYAKDILLSTTAALKDQASAMAAIAANAKIGGELFKNASIAQERFSLKATRAELERLKVMKQAYETEKYTTRQTDKPRDVNNSLMFRELFTQQKLAFGIDSIAAMKAWKSQLESVLDVLGGNSGRRPEVIKMIEEADAALQRLTEPAKKVAPAKRPGFVLLDSIEADKMKFKYAEQHQLVQQKIERIAQNIDKTQLAANDRTALSVKLEEAKLQVKKGNLSLARESAKEIDRETRDLSKAHILEKQRAAQQAIRKANWSISLNKMPEISGDIKKQTEVDAVRNIDSATKKLESIFSRLRDSSLDSDDLVAYENGLKNIAKVEEDRLSQLAREDRLLKKRFDSVMGGSSAPDKSKIQQKAVADIENATNKLESVFNKLRDSSLNDDDLVRYKNGLNDIAKVGENRLNQLGREERQLAKTVDALNKSRSPERLNEVISGQSLQFRTLQTKYETSKIKGGQFDPRAEQMLAEQIQEIEGGTIIPSERNVEILGQRIKAYQEILRNANAVLQFENAAEQKLKERGTADERKLKAENTRLGLLNNSINMEGRLISLQAKGVDITGERAQLESVIADIQASQNTATQRGNIELATRLSTLRNLLKTLELTNAAEQKGGGSKMLGGFKEKFNEMFPKGTGGRRQMTEKGFENVALGAGFPLMFGGGPGTVAGGLLGSFIGQGFGGQILGGAIGQIVDQAIISVKNLNDAFLTAGDSYSQIRQTGLRFTADLERQVMAAKAVGDFDKAKQMQSAPLLEIGDVKGAGTEGVATAVQLLQSAWDGVYKTVALTIGILGAPFIALLGLVLRIIQGIFAAVNLIATGIGALILKIPGLGKLLSDSNQSILDANAAYQDQLVELDKQITALDKTLELKSKILGITAGTVGTSKQNFEIEKRRAEALSRQADLQAKIEEIRKKSPLTKEGEEKTNQIIARERLKFLMEEFTLSANNAQSLYQEISDLNLKNAQEKIQLEKQYHDMQVDNIEQQKALNLESIRKVQDMALDRQSKEIDFIKKKRDAELEATKIAAQQASAQRKFTGILTNTSGENELVNQALDAIDKWKIGRQQIDNESKDRQLRLQFDIKKIDIEVQRYKEDSAIRIAKMNYESQKKIVEMNEGITRRNDEFERNRFGMRVKAAKAELDALKAQLQGQQFEENRSYLASIAAKQPAMAKMFSNHAKYLETVIVEVEGAMSNLKNMATPKPLSKVRPLPGFSYNTGAATKQYDETRAFVQQTENELIQLTKINSIAKEDADLWQAAVLGSTDYLEQLNSIVSEQEKSFRVQDDYVNLISKGLLPQLAEELSIRRDIDKIEKEKLDNVKALADKFEKMPGFGEIAKGLRDIINGVNKGSTAIEAQINRKFSPRQRIKDANIGILENENSYKDPTNRLINSMNERAKLEQGLFELLDPINQVTEGAKAMGGAFNDSFKSAFGALFVNLTPEARSLNDQIDQLTKEKNSLEKQMKERSAVGQSSDADSKRYLQLTEEISKARSELDLLGDTGTKVRNILADAFQKIADHFLDMATQMITQKLILKLIGVGLSAFGKAPGIGGSAGSLGDPLSNLNQYAPLPSAKGNVFTNSIVSSPTLFRFADGGALRNGVMGEAGPEAVMPLSRGPGGRLGVDASGVMSASRNALQQAGQEVAASREALQQISQGDGSGAETGAESYRPQGMLFAESRQALATSAKSQAAVSSSGSSTLTIETIQVGKLDVVTVDQAKAIADASSARGNARQTRMLQSSPSARRAMGI